MGGDAGVACSTKNVARARCVGSTSDEGEGEEAGHFYCLEFKVLKLCCATVFSPLSPQLVNER